MRAKSDHDQSERLLEESNDHVRALANGRRIMESEIKYEHLLATGQEGTVHAGVFGGTTKVAIKTSAKPVKLSRTARTALGKNELGLADILESSEYELQMHICMRLRSERVVFFYGCGITREARVFTVFELMDCALSDTLWAERSRNKDNDEETEARIVVDKPLLPWSLRLQYAADAAEGMQYLHSRNPPLLHRDLKSLNILVKGGRAKICDFGASKALQMGGLQDYEDEISSSSSSNRGHLRTRTLGSLSTSKRRRGKITKKKKKKNTSMSTFRNLLSSPSSSSSMKTPLLKSASAALSFASIPSASSTEEDDSETSLSRSGTTTSISSTSSSVLNKRKFISFEAPLMTTKIGTPQWLAPELLCSDSENVSYSLPIDVYSFGCVLFELMCQKPPWYFGADRATTILSHHFHSVFVLQEVLSSGDRPRVPDVYSAVAPVGFQDLMFECWKRDSKRRPTFDSIFQDLKNMLKVATKENMLSTSSGSSDSSSLMSDLSTSIPTASSKEEEEVVVV